MWVRCGFIVTKVNINLCAPASSSLFSGAPTALLLLISKVASNMGQLITPFPENQGPTRCPYLFHDKPNHATDASRLVNCRDAAAFGVQLDLSTS